MVAGLHIYPSLGTGKQGSARCSTQTPIRGRCRPLLPQAGCRERIVKAAGGKCRSHWRPRQAGTIGSNLVPQNGRRRHSSPDGCRRDGSVLGRRSSEMGDGDRRECSARRRVEMAAVRSAAPPLAPRWVRVYACTARWRPDEIATTPPSSHPAQRGIRRGQQWFRFRSATTGAHLRQDLRGTRIESLKAADGGLGGVCKASAATAANVSR